jgi:hypothetical protein
MTSSWASLGRFFGLTLGPLSAASFIFWVENRCSLWEDWQESRPTLAPMLEPRNRLLLDAYSKHLMMINFFHTLRLLTKCLFSKTKNHSH